MIETSLNFVGDVRIGIYAILKRACLCHGLTMRHIRNRAYKTNEVESPMELEVRLLYNN